MVATGGSTVLNVLSPKCTNQDTCSEYQGGKTLSQRVLLMLPTLCVEIIMSPKRTEFLQASNIPKSKLKAAMFNSLYIKTLPK